MKHITIKRAEQTDVDMIMQLMQEAVDTVKVSDWFLPDNRQYIEEHISDRGFTLKALSSNNEILGFFIVDLPGESKHNLGYDLNYDDHKIHKVARGLGLQRRFFKEAEKQLEDTIYEYFLGTVHPDNIYSRTNFVKAGYREARQMSKYGGMQRIIMEKEK